MKKLLVIVVLNLLMTFNVYAKSLTCVDMNTNKKYKVLYNSEQIKASVKLLMIFLFHQILYLEHIKSGKKFFWKKIDEFELPYLLIIFHNLLLESMLMVNMNGFLKNIIIAIR